MNVFLAGIMQGSLVEADIHGQDWREPIKRAFAAHMPEADLYCHYTQHPNSISYGLPQIRSTLAEGNRRAAQCDVLIAYLPSASMGTAIEMHEAARNDAVIISITPMLSNWVIRSYSDRILPDFDALGDFLASGALHELIAAKREL